MDREVLVGSTPGADDLTADQHRAGPDARRPELIAELRVRHEQVAISAVVQPKAVAAGEEPRRSRFTRGRPKAGLVRGKNPGFADRGCHGHDLTPEPLEGPRAVGRANARPFREGGRGRRAVYMQVPACELELRLR